MKSKYSSDSYKNVTPVTRDDTSRDMSKVDRTGTNTSGPSSKSNTDKEAAGVLRKIEDE
jgi:hypothetical protein